MTCVLNNDPPTLHNYMNKKIQPHVRKFVLVFFDDILIYNKIWEEHIKHVSPTISSE